jgi:predicted GH43/DUF377 family glycosyl hydrolase
MKKIILTLLIFSFIFSACKESKDILTSPSNTKTGGLSLKLMKTTIPDEVKKLIITLEKPGSMTIRDSINIETFTDTIRYTITNIPIGIWYLNIDAKDSLGIIRYQGNTYVSIYEDETTVAYVVMFPKGSGTGSLEIVITWWVSKWKMSNKNPIIRQSVSGWDSRHNYIKAPAVIKDGDIYKMWYVSGDNNLQQIAYATSTDGINWTKQGIVFGANYPSPLIEYGVDGVSILNENGIYKMWFNCKRFTNIHAGIGYATSTDGINWTINQTPVISPSPNKPYIYSPSVVKKDNLYYMFYTVEADLHGIPNIYLATSVDGINWNDQGVVLSGRNNVFWEQGGVFCPSVILDDNKFIMFYTSKSDLIGFNYGFIGKAESYDGIHWTYSSDKPELSTMDTKPWNTNLVAYPFVIKENGKLKMYFSAVSASNNMYQIGYAEQ